MSRALVDGGDSLHNHAHHPNDHGGPNGINLNENHDVSNHHRDISVSKPSTQQQGFPIAIIGMSCKLPGDASNPEKLWQLCAQGRDAWSEIPQSRFNKRAFYHPDNEKMGMVCLPAY